MFKSWGGGEGGRLTVGQSYLAGAMSGVTEGLVFQPFQVQPVCVCVGGGGVPMPE